MGRPHSAATPLQRGMTIIFWKAKRGWTSSCEPEGGRRSGPRQANLSCFAIAGPAVDPESMNQDISGEWTGDLDTGSVKVTLNFKLEPIGDGGTALLSTRSYGELALPLVRHGARWRFDAAIV